MNEERIVVTADEYNATGFEKCTETAVIQRALDRAFILIDTVTDGLCSNSAALGERKKEMLKRAVYAQCEQYVMRTDFDTERYSRVEIGEYAYTMNEKENTGVGICPIARMLLVTNGLISICAEVK